MPTEAEKEQFKMYKEMLFTAIRERFKVLPTISALAATLLVVATFNKDLLPIDIFVKLLLLILLLIIPFSLFGYLWELKKSEDKAVKWFEKFGGASERSCFDVILAHYPWIIFGLMSFVILTISILIFKPEVIYMINNLKCK